MSAMNPDSLRALLQALEPLRGHVIASGHIEDGTDTSVGADLLLDDGYAHADQWEADLDRGAVACPELREDNNRFRKDNAALRKAINNLAICPLCNRDIGTGEKHLPGCLAALASQPVQELGFLDQPPVSAIFDDTITKRLSKTRQMLEKKLASQPEVKP